MHLRYRQPTAGFTLIEMIIVIVALGILSVYAVMTSVSSADVTLPSQAQKLASDIRHAQTLAYTWGKRMRLTVAAGANGSYSVSCIAGASGSPCDTSNDFSTAVQKDVVLGGSTLYFNSLGQPSDSAGTAISTATSYTLSSGGSTATITVAALTGLVTVSL